MEKLGLIVSAVRLVKKDEELIERIMVARDYPEDYRKSVADMLKMNIWTVNQFRDLTGKKESTILNKTRPGYKGGELKTELDFCYPFSDIDGLGPKFIVRNEKSEALLP
jgi:hypothetical protein